MLRDHKTVGEKTEDVFEDLIEEIERPKAFRKTLEDHEAEGPWNRRPRKTRRLEDLAGRFWDRRL